MSFVERVNQDESWVNWSVIMGDSSHGPKGVYWTRSEAFRTGHQVEVCKAWGASASKIINIYICILRMIKSYLDSIWHVSPLHLNQGSCIPNHWMEAPSDGRTCKTLPGSNKNDCGPLVSNIRMVCMELNSQYVRQYQLCQCVRRQSHEIFDMYKVHKNKSRFEKVSIQWITETLHRKCSKTKS